MKPVADLFPGRTVTTRACGVATASSPTLPLPLPSLGIAPLDGGHLGTRERKPWETRITAAIPHLETIEPLKVCLDVLRWQTARPFIMVIDTGSTPQTRDQLEQLRADDVEIHYLQAHAWRHASEPVAAALDVAQALCRTEFLFHTHADCFLRRRDFLAEMIARCNSKEPVIGYRMSPRDWATTEWRWMVGHTATVLHMPTIHTIGATWSMQRMHEQFGYPWTGKCGGWPDTETGFNCVLREHHVAPVFIGHDRNYERQVDSNIDHVRSYAGSKLYSAKYHAEASKWMKTAIAEAKARISTRQT